MGFYYSQLLVTPPYPSQSFDGQTVIVTGSNSGLGKEAARHIARLGAKKLILAVRNVKAGNEAKEDIVSSTKCDSNVIEVWTLDLASHKSVKAFAEKAIKELDRVDVLLENAGVSTTKFAIEEETGYERTVTVNVINTFYLALLMLPKLKQTAKDHRVNPRLTIVVSEVHAWSPFPEWEKASVFEALNQPNEEAMSRRYPNSKLLEVLVIQEIAPKLKGTGVILNMLNPGLCHSEIGRDMSIWFAILKFFLARTTEVGSRTLVASAAAGEETHGSYMSDARVENHMISSFVTSEDGKKASEKVWKELKVILEKIDPGVTKAVDA